MQDARCLLRCKYESNLYKSKSIDAIFICMSSNLEKSLIQIYMQAFFLSKRKTFYEASYNFTFSSVFLNHLSFLFLARAMLISPCHLKFYHSFTASFNYIYRLQSVVKIHFFSFSFFFSTLGPTGASLFLKFL